MGNSKLRNKKMKLIIAIVFALAATHVYSVSCVKTNYCMGCHASIVNQCIACFNWGSGKVGARALNTTANPNHCQTALAAGLKVTDTKDYSGGTSAASGTVNNMGSVLRCKKTYQNFVNSSNTLTCSKTAITISPAASKVKNCQTTRVYDGTTDNFGCMYCKKKYAQSGTYYSNGSVGSSACAKYSGVANCDYIYKSAASTYACAGCKSKYAIASGNATCVSYTADKNCWRLQSGNTTCETCWSAYYWDTSKCKLAAKIVMAGLAVVASMLL